jgi:hypothetical protein
VISRLLLILFIVAHVDAWAKSTPSKGLSQNAANNVIPNVFVIKFSNNYQISENTLNSSNSQLNKHLNTSGILTLKKIFSSESVNLKKSVPINLTNIYLASYQSEKSPQEMAELASAWPGVIYAEPKYYRYISEDIPNDTLYSIQSDYYEVIEAPQAWEIVKGEQGSTIIAIVDGGTEITHSDLSDNIWQNQAEVDGITGVDDDDNGFIDDYYGWNFANQTGDPTGLPGLPNNSDHGTQTAGIASAVTDNINGVSGTSWNTTIMGICASDESSDRVIAYGFEGIVYAANNGADIISCSWGSLGGYSYHEQEAVDFATSMGSLVIAAAGNNSSDQSHYPSSYNNALSIAGTTVNDDRYSKTNYGPDIDLAAPAVNIYSTKRNNSYGFASGTSLAAPMVSGAAGLVKTQHPEWIGLQIGEQVRVTVDSLQGEEGQLGRGRLNVYRAVTETSPSIRLIDYEFEDESGNGTIEPGERVSIYITVQNFLDLATDVDLILTSSDPYMTISQPGISIPSITTMEKIEPGTPFICDIAEDTPSNHTIDFVLQISTNEYNDVDYLNLTVVPGYLNLSINNVKMTVTSLGRIVNSDLFESEDTVGFAFKYSGNLLYEGAIISGTSASQISNAARAGLGADDHDFVVTSDGLITNQIPGSLSDEESFGQFVDEDAAYPMNVEITQYTYAWSDSINDDYIIMLFVIRNRAETDLNNFHFGWFFDWDIDGETYDSNVVQYDSERKMGYAYDTGIGPETNVGVVSLSDEEMNFEAIYNDDLGVFTDTKKWLSISSGIVAETAGPEDVSFVIANGPITIPAYSNYKLAFAMVGADDSLSLFENADSAQTMWENLKVLDMEPDEKSMVPYTFSLSQNYPNPFNPMTIINYKLRITNDVELTIYNVLGEKVKTLVSENQAAGSYSIEWDASGLASGIYYYELRTSDFKDVKKLVLMK